ELVAELRDDRGERGRACVLVQLNAEALSQPALALPPDFQAGVLRIRQIRAEGLRNTELFGKADPYIQVALGDWAETTDTLHNAGSDVTWSVDMTAEVTRERLSEKMLLRVMDENRAGDVLLGTASCSLRSLRLGDVELRADLVASGAAAGTVVLTARLEQCRPEDLQDVPEGAVTVRQGLVAITAISASDLKGGGGLLGLGGKQDPYVVLSLDSWSAQTEVKQNGASWEVDDMELAVTQDVLRYKRVTVTVYDKNSMDAWLGQGSFSLCRLGAQPDTPLAHLVGLKDKRGRSAGRVSVTAKLLPLPDPEVGGVEQGGGLGRLQLAQCWALKLPETASLGKQDLTATLAVGGWGKRTDTHKGAGTQAEWAIRESTPLCSLAQLAEVRVGVLGRSMTGERLLGTACISLQKSVAQPG
ncbi:hypothetical protein B484DRAFT_440444, partial [Ochromonadaceae sp. CCMP2298]